MTMGIPVPDAGEATKAEPNGAPRAADVRAPMRRIRPPNQEVELTEEEAAEQYKGEPLDPLEELLAYDSETRFTDDLDMSKYGFKATWRIQNLQGEQHSQLIERASKVIKNTGSGTLQKQLDGPKFQRLVVAYGVVAPNHRDRKVFAKYNRKPTQEDTLIAEIYRNRPGLVYYVAQAVLDLSGFSEDLVEVAKSAD